MSQSPLFRIHRWSCLALAFASAFLGGCATTLPDSLDRSSFHKLLQARSLDAAAVPFPFEVTEEMRTWVHREVPEGGEASARLDRLLQALLSSNERRLEYESHYTATAPEVFTTRRANCMSFTNLFVALAREVGIPVFFLDVEDVEKYEREGDLIVVSGHISAGFGSGPNLRILEFTPNPPNRKRLVRQITDLTAAALHYSNRGGELLRLGKHEEALPWLKVSVALDPTLARGWVNLGVALRRSGDPAAAERAYRRALEEDADSVSGYQNLAALLRLRGQEEEATQLLVLSHKVGTRNPFSYLSLGDVSLSHGRLEEARQFYRKALRLYRGHAEPYAAMGQWALAAGHRLEAQRWLSKAASLDQANERVKVLASRLSGPDKRRAGEPRVLSLR